MMDTMAREIEGALMTGLKAAPRRDRPAIVARFETALKTLNAARAEVGVITTDVAGPVPDKAENVPTQRDPTCMLEALALLADEIERQANTISRLVKHMEDRL